VTEEEITCFLAFRGVPKRYLSARRGQIADSTWQDVQPFLAGESLYLWGPTGSGKTHLAVALMREDWIAKPSRRPIFVKVPPMLLEIREVFSASLSERAAPAARTERSIIDRYATADLLILDDVGTEKISDWAIQTLSVIVDQRYSEMRRTLVTSNLSLEELSDRIGDRTASRLSGMSVIAELSGSDRRVNRLDRLRRAE
jgi:DNA replication protein DnaC